MAVLTLEVDEEVLVRARREALRRGTSVEMVATERVRELAGPESGATARAIPTLAELTEKHSLFFPEGRIPNREERNAR